MFGPAAGYRTEDWRLLRLMYLVGLFQGYAQTQATNTLPFVRSAFELSQSEASYLFAIARIGSLVAVIYGVFADRWGRRGPFLTAYLLLMGATAVTSLAFSPTAYTALQVLARMGGAALAMLSAVLVAEQVRWSGRAWALSLYSSAVAIGAGAALLALPVAQAMDEGWRLLFAAAAPGLGLYLWLRVKVEESQIFRHGAEGGILDPLFGPEARYFWPAASYSIFLAAFSAVAVTFSLDRLVHGLGMTSSEAVRLMLIGGTIGGTGFFLGGRLGDTVGRRITIWLSLLIGLAGGLGFYWLTSPEWLAAAAAVSAFGSSAALSVTSAQRTELFPTGTRATATQWLHATSVLGAIAGLALAGRLVDELGLSVTVSLLGIGVVIAMALQFLIPETLGVGMSHPTNPRKENRSRRTSR